jgi:hypothetical protein
VTAVGLIHRFWQETTGERMAWTADTRRDYVRPSGTYASDATDREWALLAPLLPAPRPGGRPRTTCLRRVVNAIFYLLQAGCQWRMLPRDFPPPSTVYGYFRAGSLLEKVGFDAGKRIKGRKRHLVTDTLGLMLCVEVHSAGVQDRDAAALVLNRITRRFPFIERFFADAGYQGPRVEEAAPCPVEIIKRTDTGFVVQPKRW